MKPTKDQRFIIYNLMLNNFIADINYENTSGFCNEIRKVTNFGYLVSENIKHYPELMRYKPIFHFGDNWFTVINQSGRLKRIDILKSILNEKNNN